MLDRVVPDVRYALRTLLGEPAWTAATVCTLALAIGATTAIFSFVNGVLLRPLDYEAPEGIVTLEFLFDASRTGGAATGLDEDTRRHLSLHTTYPNFVAWRGATADVFEDVAVFDDAWTYTLGYTDGSSRLSAALVTASLFRVLGVPPLLGRTFADGEDDVGSEDAVVLSHGLWQRRFGGRADIVGDVVSVNEMPHTVVGVMPEGFAFPSRDVEFWLPMARASRGEGSWNYTFVARLKDGIDRERADVLLRDRAVDQTGWEGAEERWTAAVRSLHEYFVGDVRSQLLVFVSAVTAVLLIACVNVANLMLTRAAGREKEHVVRAALGAGRSRLAQQLLTESVVVSLAGGALGLALAHVLTRSLLALSPASVPRQELVGVDGAALGFTFGVSMLVGVTIGILPALRAANTSLSAGLGASTRASRSSRQNRVRDGLVVVQIAMAMTLLVCAGLLLRSFLAVLAVEEGFDPHKVLTFETSLPRSLYPTQTDRELFYGALLDELDALPSVRSTALALYLPGGQFHSTEFDVPGYVPAPGEDLSTEIKEVSSGYFPTMSIRLVRGRLFDERDNAEAPAVVLINETMARRYWPGRDAVGQRMTLGDADVEVIGVVDAVRYRAGGRDHGETDSRQVYRPYAGGTPTGDMDVLVRTDVPPARLAPAVRRLLGSLDPEVALFGIMTMEKRLNARVSEPRFRTLLLGGFGLAALLLAAIGIYGVMAYAVTQRTRELGIRRAIGAPKTRILGQVIGRGLALTIAGLVLGSIGAYAATTLLESFLYQLGAHDPVSFALGFSVLLATALSACAIPAYRASQVDPMIALRAE